MGNAFTTFTGSSQLEVFDLIEYLKQEGRQLINYSEKFTTKQLALFIDDLFQIEKKKEVKGAPTDRSLSKSLCCFLFELSQNGPSHYATIRSIVKEKYNHQTNDYGSLQ